MALPQAQPKFEATAYHAWEARAQRVHRRIEPLQKCLLDELDACCVELFRRDPESHWGLHDVAAADTLRLASVACELPVAAVFGDTDERDGVASEAASGATGG